MPRSGPEGNVQGFVGQLLVAVAEGAIKTAAQLVDTRHSILADRCQAGAVAAEVQTKHRIAVTLPR